MEKYREDLKKMDREDLIKCSNKVNFKNLNVKDYGNLDIRELGFFLLRWFRYKGLGNPFNYNRFMEFVQASYLGYKLLGVGGGSDGINEKGETTEFKATGYLGFRKGSNVEKSHSFTYNGTSRQDTLEKQKIYCKKKIMRDPLHHWSMIDYENGKLLKTIQLSNNQVWKILWPKWERSWYNSNSKDPRIGGSISINELNKEGIKYIIIEH